MYLRLPDDLKERVFDSAVQNGRNVNGEICHQLRQVYGVPAVVEVVTAADGGEPASG